MEIKHINKAPPSPERVVSIDVRLTAQEVVAISQVFGTLNVPTAKALGVAGSAYLYRMAEDVGLPKPPLFTAKGDSLYLVTTNYHGATAGYLEKTPTRVESVPQDVVVEWGDGKGTSRYTPAAAAEELTSFRRGNKRLRGENADLKRELAEARKQLEAGREQMRVIEGERDQLRRHLNTATKMFEDIKSVCDAEYCDYT